MSNRECFELLTWLTKVLVAELDRLTAIRARFRANRLYWHERTCALSRNESDWPPAPVPHQTPYDSVIDRLDNALQATYDNLNALHLQEN